MSRVPPPTYAYLVVEWAPLPKVDGAGPGLQLLSEPEGARVKEASISLSISVPVAACLSLVLAFTTKCNRVFLRSRKGLYHKPVQMRT